MGFLLVQAMAMCSAPATPRSTQVLRPVDEFIEMLKHRHGVLRHQPHQNWCPLQTVLMSKAGREATAPALQLSQRSTETLQALVPQDSLIACGAYGQMSDLSSFWAGAVGAVAGLDDMGGMRWAGVLWTGDISGL